MKINGNATKILGIIKLNEFHLTDHASESGSIFATRPMYRISASGSNANIWDSEKVAVKGLSDKRFGFQPTI